ncbi:hypothetical protein T01_1574 [Trichinella spiralis]|uniref:Uncharacterized protein n=1 Tax=Trichinella spiralis TaxID=6334 RepID=A0A0V1BMJ3_TRISP|nr:hypothetical protein T01_1574 [Trichinella spiralis]
MVSRVHEDGLAYQLQNFRKGFRINKVEQTKRLRNQTGCLIGRLRFGLPYAETGQAIRDFGESEIRYLSLRLGIQFLED